jgi:hypothetical protein
MRLDVLHRKVADDARVLYAVVNPIFPAILPSRYEGKPFGVRQFIKRLNHVSEPLNLFNEIENDKELAPGQLLNSAFWLAKAELPENDSRASIRMLWHVHPGTKRVEMMPVEWGRRRLFFWQNILHEMIHCYQEDHQPRVYRTRSTQRDIKEQQAYYGSTDEIEAHAHAAATELFVLWGHLSYRDACHEAQTYTGRTIEPTIQHYLTAFADTPGHPALKHFKRKMRMWYQVIQADPEIYFTLELHHLVTL